MPEKNAVLNWSSGKDAAFSLFKVLQEKQFEVRYLLTTLNKANDRISMHGVRECLLQEQARRLSIPLKKIYLPENADMPTYNKIMADELDSLKKENIGHMIFGDIFLEEVKKYREDHLALMQMKGVFPLWEKNTTTLIHEFLDAGFKAVVSCVNARLLDKDHAGQPLDRYFLKNLPSGVDPCGENGEFHTFVYDGPVFDQPVKFKTGDIVEKVYPSSSSEPGLWDNRFYFCDLVPA